MSHDQLRRRAMKKNEVDKSRRSFLGATAAGAAAAASFTIIPSSALGGAGKTAPSDKLNIAGIGIGGRGKDNLRVMSENGHNIVALCDVDDKYAAPVYEKYPNAKRYRDFRIMLEKEKSIDAVMIATPDHLHAPIAMMAIKMGKHVYCEKPLTYSIYESRKLAEAAREAGVATQMGNVGQAGDFVRDIHEMINDGAIGDVREVHEWTDRPIWPQGMPHPKEPQPVPDHFDWDLWQGPAPERPYHRSYTHFVWRGWLDYGAGALGDIGCHRFAPIFMALGLGHPTSVEASSSPTNDASYPLASIVRYKFPGKNGKPGITLHWYDGGLKPERPEEMGDAPNPLGGNGPTIYVGDKGKMLNNKLIPESRDLEYQRPPKTMPRSPGHYQEWFDACRGGKPAGANFDMSSLVTEVVLLGNIAIRTGKKLYWDGPNLTITNIPEANQYIHREYREGWTL